MKASSILQHILRKILDCNDLYTQQPRNAAGLFDSIELFGVKQLNFIDRVSQNALHKHRFL